MTIDPVLALGGFLVLSLAANLAQAHTTSLALRLRKTRSDRDRVHSARTIVAPAWHAPRRDTPGHRLAHLVENHSSSSTRRRS